MADAFGEMVRDYHRGELRAEARHRRSDGVTWDAGPEWYFSEPADWSDAEVAALEAVSGRVLDLGCGAGRHARHLQARGHEVLGVAGSRAGLRSLLADLEAATAPGGRLIADVLDPTAVDDPDRRAYLDERATAPGVTTRRFRVEYGTRAGPWIDLLQLTSDALADAVACTGWRLIETRPAGDETYYATLESG